MAGRKRAAEDTTSDKRETRSSKVAKTQGAKPSGRAAKGTARLKTSLAQTEFKSRAMPLHVSITSTAPALEGQESTLADPGFMASTTLIPSTFATGSFGWKGHKRMVVELPKAEGEGEGEGEKVHVTLTINATVIGSKDAKEEYEGEMQGVGEHVAKVVGEPKQGEESPRAEVKEGDDKQSAAEEQAEQGASS